jgi:hypothetical protein
MIGHLDVEERAVLWDRLATTAADGGFAIVGLQPPGRPQRLERSVMTAVEVGRHRYVGLAEAEPTGPRSMRWTMTYRKTAGPAVLKEAVNTFDWWTVSVDDIRDEVTGVGLTVEPGAEGLVVIRSPVPRTGRR